MPRQYTIDTESRVKILRKYLESGNMRQSVREVLPDKTLTEYKRLSKNISNFIQKHELEKAKSLRAFLESRELVECRK